MGRHKKQQVETSVLKHFTHSSLWIDLSEDENLLPYLKSLPLDERRCGVEMNLERCGKKTFCVKLNPIVSIEDLDGLASFYLNVATRLNEISDELEGE